jgi:hypothetical protein
METFVIQIPTSHDRTTEPRPGELRGVVEHVSSGSRRAFTNTRELLAFLRADHPRSSKEAEC